MKKKNRTTINNEESDKKIFPGSLTCDALTPKMAQTSYTI